MMATKTKQENPEYPECLENSELEVMRAKIRTLEQKKFELEATVQTNEKLLMSKDKELQLIKKGEVDIDHHEANKKLKQVIYLQQFIFQVGCHITNNELFSYSRDL